MADSHLQGSAEFAAGLHNYDGLNQAARLAAAKRAAKASGSEASAYRYKDERLNTMKFDHETYETGFDTEVLDASKPLGYDVFIRVPVVPSVGTRALENPAWGDLDMLTRICLKQHTGRPKGSFHTACTHAWRHADMYRLVHQAHQCACGSALRCTLAPHRIL